MSKWFVSQLVRHLMWKRVTYRNTKHLKKYPHFKTRKIEIKPMYINDIISEKFIIITFLE